MEQRGSGINLRPEGVSVPFMQRVPSLSRIPEGRKERKLKSEVMIAEKKNK